MQAGSFLGGELAGLVQAGGASVCWKRSVPRHPLKGHLILATYGIAEAIP